MQLVEEAVEGCWIGFRARLPAAGSEIGTVYAPPSAGSQFAFGRSSVETVIDIGLRSKGWHLVCEKGGLRRVMMNLIGNSLKFTSVSKSNVIRLTLLTTGSRKGTFMSLCERSLPWTRRLE